MRKIEYLSLFVIAVIFFLAYEYYGLLPEEIVSHWNINGKPDGYMNKNIILLLSPFSALIVFGIFSMVSRIKDKNGSYIFIDKENIRYVDILLLLIIIFFLYIQALIIAVNITGNNSLITFIPVYLSVLFYYMGDILPTLKPNNFIGVRTPWAMKDERTWYLTQKVAGRLFKFSGVIGLFGFLFKKQAFYFLFVPIFLSLFYIYVDSYIIYKRNKEGENGNGN